MGEETRRDTALNALPSLSKLHNCVRDLWPLRSDTERGLALRAGGQKVLTQLKFHYKVSKSGGGWGHPLVLYGPLIERVPCHGKRWQQCTLASQARLRDRDQEDGTA